MNNDSSDSSGPGHGSHAGAPIRAVGQGSQLHQRDNNLVSRSPLDTQAARIMEANQRLVVAALQSQAVAEKATERLDDITLASQRDALTGLPGRALLKDRLDRALGMAQRHATQAAVMFIDIDQFKRINDNFGHTVGDEALKLVANRLEAVVRHSDTVSRHSGDEFVVLLSEISLYADAAQIARKMLAAVSTPFYPGEQTLSLTVSIGIAIYPGDGIDATSLIANADTAMYRSKKAGGDEFHFYNEDIDDAESEWHDASRPMPLGDDVLVRGLSDRYRELVETNAQLAITLAATQELLAACAQSHVKQLDMLTDVAHALHDPRTSIQMEHNLGARVRPDDDPGTQTHQPLPDPVTQLVRKVEDILAESRVSALNFLR